ncbi:MAG: hypothetical protein QXH03_02755 [Candidatus Bathyarchaeia archaeon]
MSCPPQLVIAPEQRFQVMLDWQNNGTQPYAFDLLLLMKQSTETTYSLVSYILDQTLNPNQTTTTTLFDGWFKKDASKGEYDVAALICDFDPNVGIIAIYDALECLRSIKLT